MTGKEVTKCISYKIFFLNKDKGFLTGWVYPVVFCSGFMSSLQAGSDGACESHKFPLSAIMT